MREIRLPGSLRPTTRQAEPQQDGETMVKLKRCLSGCYRVFGLTAAFVLVILLFLMTLPQTAAAAGTWTATGSLVTGRYGHTATLLLDGKVLVAGGIGALTSAELYDPATGIWTTTGSLNHGRANHTATLLNNGKVLVAGGGPLKAEIYDPTRLRGPGARPASFTTAAPITRPPSLITARSWWRGALRDRWPP